MSQKYRVYLYIEGAPSRPPYSGYVDVFADDPQAAGEAAKRILRRTTFPDVWTSSMRVERVEWRPQ
jgi:hypothetical protein